MPCAGVACYSFPSFDCDAHAKVAQAGANLRKFNADRRNLALISANWRKLALMKKSLRENDC